MNSLIDPRRAALALTIGAALALPAHVYAHSEDHDKAEKAEQIDYEHAEKHTFGKAADPTKAKRTIVVEMSDAMRFEPALVTVDAGEAVNFEIHNDGQLMHEMVIGTEEELAEHAAMMQKFPGMEHEEPYMAHVSPSKKMNMGWQFTEAGEYYYACLVPGHMEAGMKGTITVK